MLKHVWSVINIIIFLISNKLSINETIINVRHENLMIIGVFLHNLDKITCEINLRKRIIVFLAHNV